MSSTTPESHNSIIRFGILGFFAMAWRHGIGWNGQGMGFWFRMGRKGHGWGFAWSVVTPDYHPIFSERYSGQHGIPKRRVLYIPVGFNRRWRMEIIRPLGGSA